MGAIEGCLAKNGWGWGKTESSAVFYEASCQWEEKDNLQRVPHFLPVKLKQMDFGLKILIPG